METERVESRRGLYGVAAIRVARHRWLHLRALVRLAPSCEVQYGTDTELISTLVRHLSSRPQRAQVRQRAT